MPQSMRRLAAGSSRSAGVVVLHRDAGAISGGGYEDAVRAALAERLALLQGFEYCGEYDAATRYGGGVYFVPSDTLDVALADALGIRGERDLFGGVVPHAFVATKAITQPLPDAGAQAPSGWSHGLHARIAGATLRGFTAFTLDDARRAGRRLLADAVVRIKPVGACGGAGQSVVRDAEELEAVLRELDARALTRVGVVLEENLDDVVTFCVGRVRVGVLLASYCGTQQLTTNNRGHRVYGGSTLRLVRGDFDALQSLDLDGKEREAVRQVLAYDRGVRDAYPGLILSRSNYDVSQGHDAQGRWRSGVLEQSWRIGGASPAEIAGLEVFAERPDARVVRVSCVETYGAYTPPDGASVLFHGDDERAGPIAIHSLIEEIGNA